jgi:hypothetical protein
VGELVGVADDPHRLNPPIDHVDRHDVGYRAVGRAQNPARLLIDPDELDVDGPPALLLACQLREHAGDAGPAEEWLARRGDLPAAIRVERRVLGKHPL